MGEREGGVSWGAETPLELLHKFDKRHKIRVNKAYKIIHRLDNIHKIVRA